MKEKGPTRFRRQMVMIVACMSLSTACTQQVAPSGEHAAMLRREPDVPFVTTPPAVVARMLEIARVTKDDVVYDLGSGDGRIVIMAAQKFGARGVGVEIDPELVSAAQENAKKAGVAGRVQFVLQDLFDVDISAATVVTLYLTQAVNLQLRPKLWRELKPGTRVVSHDFSMGDWRPEQVVYIDRSIIYAWTIPAATMPRP